MAKHYDKQLKEIARLKRELRDAQDAGYAG